MRGSCELTEPKNQATQRLIAEQHTRGDLAPHDSQHISNTDLADPRRRHADAATCVGDVMTRVIYAVRADDAVLTAVRLMADENIHRAIVVNDDGTLAGIVVPMDILRVLAREAEARGADAHVEYVDLGTLQGVPQGGRTTIPTAIVFESARMPRAR